MMKKKWTKFLFNMSLCIVLLLVGLSSSARAATDFSERAVIYCNEIREQYKLPPFNLSESLSALATQRAKEQSGYSGARGMRSNEKSWRTFYTEAGFSYNAISGELILHAYGEEQSYAEIIDYWKNTEGCWQHLLSNYSSVGIGQYYSRTDRCTYYCMVFGKREPRKEVLSYQPVDKEIVYARTIQSTYLYKKTSKSYERSSSIKNSALLRVVMPMENEELNSKWVKVYNGAHVFYVQGKHLLFENFTGESPNRITLINSLQSLNSKRTVELEGAIYSGHYVRNGYFQISIFPDDGNTFTGYLSAKAAKALNPRLEVLG